MVLISFEKKFIYIKTMKTAGSSVESFFGMFCCDDKKNYKYSDKTKSNISNNGIIGFRLFKDGSKWEPHLKAHKILEYIGREKFNSYIKFCVIRNPFDYLVSLYEYQNRHDKNKISFKKFIFQNKLNNWDLYNIDNKPVCDFYIRYENLEEDVRKLLKLLKIEDYNVEIPKHKSGIRKNKNYKDYYDLETRKYVENLFKNELSYHNYKF